MKRIFLSVILALSLTGCSYILGTAPLIPVPATPTPTTNADVVPSPKPIATPTPAPEVDGGSDLPQVSNSYPWRGDSIYGVISGVMGELDLDAIATTYGADWTADDIPVYEMEGEEQYLIIPRYADTEFKLRPLTLDIDGEDMDLVAGDVVHTFTTSDPFILQCNVSDLFPNTQVVATVGDHAVQFNPATSLKDGTVDGLTGGVEFTADGAVAEIVMATISIQDYGDIVLELDPRQAPITVENFVKLAESGFYNGLTFHRIIDGFMMQGGDPEGTVMGGAPDKIKGEFTANGVENTLSHTRGIISMARAQNYDSASSQFFIVHQDSTFLDGQYAAFGYVESGMDVVDAICTGTPVEDGNGTVAAENQPIITSITIQ